MHPRTTGKAAVAWGAIDMLGCLFLVMLVLINPPPKKTTSVDTLGVYAVTISWKNGSNDDVDLYVEDPSGNICFFTNDSVGLMHLEHDDLGTNASETEGGVRVVRNGERVVIRGSLPGEYIVNVHLYMKNDPGDIPVTVELWRLRGNDRSLISKRIVLTRQGEAITPFRFSLNRQGDMTGKSYLPKNIVSTAAASAVSPESSDRMYTVPGNGTQRPGYSGP